METSVTIIYIDDNDKLIVMDKITLETAMNFLNENMFVIMDYIKKSEWAELFAKLVRNLKKWKVLVIEEN